jgi:serine/threonine protein kinase
MEAALSPAPRRFFGRYELLRSIAVGGMAEVHLARVAGLGGFERLVALKRMLPECAAHDDFVSMFLNEARIAAALHHSNIVQVYDFGRVEQRYFMSMEYLDGLDLRQLLQRLARSGRTLPIGPALTIALGLCAALHYAHERLGADGKPLGLLHRDVSPHNVFVTWDGCVKLLDFGVARAASPVGEQRAGELIGKVGYLSPEQCEGLPLDRRSDVFALSVVLWEMTLCRRLFRCHTPSSTMRRIVEVDAPPPSRLRPAYPRELERIVMKGLARDLSARYPSVEALQVDLEAFAFEHRIPLSAPSLQRWLREVDPATDAPRLDDDLTPCLTPRSLLGAGG